MRYDPAIAPDPMEWLATGESDRLEAVLEHLAGDRGGAPSARMHAVMHLTVENQLAEGHPDATATMGRLLREGLERHEALHAIGAVVGREMFKMLKSKRLYDPLAYARRLARLTADSWRRGDID